MEGWLRRRGELGSDVTMGKVMERDCRFGDGSERCRWVDEGKEFGERVDVQMFGYRQ